MSEPDCSQQAYAEAQYDHDYRKLEADNERLRGLLREARNSGMLWTGIAQRIDAALSTNSSEISSGLVVTDQPNGATGWIDNAVTPPGESVERVLVAYPTGLVETTQAHYVRLYPTNYPWWMPLPVAPDPTPQPQPDAVASTFADCETAMGMEYTTPPCACAVPSGCTLDHGRTGRFRRSPPGVRWG